MFKKIGKFFKKIGRGIKKGFKKFGKFMGKLGIVGQIAMMFIMPGIGNAMMSTFGSVLKGLGTLGRVGQAAQTVLGAAGNFTRLVAKPFTTITDGISTFLSNTTKFLTNKTAGLFGKQAVFQGAPTTFLGADGVIGQTATNISNNVAGFADIGRDLLSNDVSAFTDRAFGATRIKPTTTETDLPSSPVGAVAEKRSLLDFIPDRLKEPFTPTKLVEGFAQGTAKGVTNVGVSATLNAVGLGPEYETYASQRGYTPQFQSEQALLATGHTPIFAVDQGGADVTGQETYASYINMSTMGNQSGLGYGGSQNYNKWIDRSVSAFSSPTMLGA